MRRHQHLLPLRDPGPHPLRHRRPFRPPQHLPQLVQPHQMLAGRPGHRRPHPRITTSIPAGTGVGVIPVATVTDRPGNTRPTSARQFSVRSGLHATGSVARTGQAVGVPGLGVELLPHQHAAVRYAVSRRRLIIGDEIFMTVADTGGVNRAAHELHTVQSNVSARLTALERDLGVPLFRRHSQEVALTNAGEQVVAASRVSRTARSWDRRSDGYSAAALARQALISLSDQPSNS